MNKKFLRITDKLETEIIIILEKLFNTAHELNIDFFVVGAIGRDIIFTHCYGIQTGRATNDIDLGVNLESWDHYYAFTKKLCSDTKFVPAEVVHRFEYNEYPVDIIPFGKISDRTKKILWPPDQTREMNLLGFEEAFSDSIIVRLREDPVLDIPIVSPLGFALLKFFYWADRNDEIKDAHDLLLVISNYADLGNEERIYEVDEILNQEDFDYQMAGAMLLGYDIASIATEQTLNRVIEILDNETGKSTHYKLIENMLILDSDNKFDFNLKLLQSLKSGIMIR
jgi:predicted nucleotidyltransferase